MFKQRHQVQILTALELHIKVRMLIECIRSFEKIYSPELCLESFSSQHTLHIARLQLIEEPRMEPTWKCNVCNVMKIWIHSRFSMLQCSAMGLPGGGRPVLTAGSSKTRLIVDAFLEISTQKTINPTPHVHYE